MEGARQASADDLARLAELAAAARASLVARRGGDLLAAERPPVTTADLAADLAEPERLLVSGTLDGYPVGYLRARVTTLTDGRTLGVVDEIYVEPDARGVGVGEAMLSAALSWWRDRGCAGVDATALPGDRETKNFFEAHGFAARLLVMHRPLDDAP